MAKDPAFPFYAQDYLVDTIRWTRSMQGLHVSLLAESWANGGLVDDGGNPAGLGSTDVDIWLKIKHKWICVDGLWINEKLEEVRTARNNFIEKQREKGILSASKRKKQSTKIQPETNSGSTAVEPIENEKENEKEIQNKNECVSKNEISDAIFKDERYMTDILIAHKDKDLRQAFEECWIHHSQTPSPPEHLWQWKQKFNSWLTIKGNKNGNRPVTTGTFATISAQIGGTNYDNQQL